MEVLIQYFPRLPVKAGLVLAGLSNSVVKASPTSSSTQRATSQLPVANWKEDPTPLPQSGRRIPGLYRSLVIFLEHEANYTVVVSCLWNPKHPKHTKTLKKEKQQQQQQQQQQQTLNKHTPKHNTTPKRQENQQTPKQPPSRQPSN